MSSVPDWLQFVEHGSGSGFRLATTNRGPDLVVELADFIDGEAWWTCLHSGRRLCVIGSLE